MGKSSSKSKHKKNKGPKGKKARAKAKLERQWGEQATTTGRDALRHGKSRLLSESTAAAAALSHHEPSKHMQEEEEETLQQTLAQNYQQFDSSSDEDDNNNDDTTTNACSSLLQSIRQQQQPGQQDLLEESDSDSDDDEQPMQVDHNQQQDEVDDSHDDDDDESLLLLASDPFTLRFGNTTTPNAQTSPADALQKIKLAEYNIESSADDDDAYDHLEVQASEALLQQLQAATSTPAIASNSCVFDWPKLARAYWNNTRQVLQKRWKTTQSQKASSAPLDPMQRVLFPALASYADILWTTCHGNNGQQHERIQQHAAAALHILHHVLTTRSRIQRHNRRLADAAAAKQQQQQPQPPPQDDENDDAAVLEDAVRDQGFTRPTVLVLLPTRGVCHAFVQLLLQLLGDAPAVDKLERFHTEYGPHNMVPMAAAAAAANTTTDADAVPQEGAAAAMDQQEEFQAKRRRRKQVLQQKGREWLELFGDDVNDDDDFRVGLSLHPKGGKRKDATADSNVAVKLFTDFYKSDIILASPLGLKMTTAASGNDDNDDGDDDPKEPNCDFLSSIEICLLLQSDVLMMQNWDHCADVLAMLNQKPKHVNATDFSRVRPYLLDEDPNAAAYYRQLIVLAPFQDPLFLSTFKRHAKSRAGQLRVKRRVPTEQASISQVLMPHTRQVFQRIHSSTFARQAADRLEYFLTQVLPVLRKHEQKHTLIYIPSYFEFLSLRNALLKRQLESHFCSVTEYARTTEINRGRARFLQGRRSWMLYTGRAHFFHRHLIKGVRHLVFFGLPEHADFYPQHVNFLNEGLQLQQQQKQQDENNDGAGSTMMDDRSESCLVLYTKYESHALERIVGTSNCNRMIKGDKSTFVFTA